MNPGVRSSRHSGRHAKVPGNLFVTARKPYAPLTPFPDEIYGTQASRCDQLAGFAALAREFSGRSELSMSSFGNHGDYGAQANILAAVYGYGHRRTGFSSFNFES